MSETTENQKPEVVQQRLVRRLRELVKLAETERDDADKNRDRIGLMIAAEKIELAKTAVSLAVEELYHNQPNDQDKERP